MEKKNNTWIIILLVLIILGLVGFICYDKFIVQKSNSSNDIMSKDEASALAKELWDKYDITDSCNYEYIFLKDNLSYDNLLISTNIEGDIFDGKIGLAYSLQKKDNVVTVEEKTEICEEYSIVPCSRITSPVKDLEDSYANLFGDHKVIDKKSFFTDSSLSCEIKNDVVECHNVAGGNLCDLNIIASDVSISNFEQINKSFIITVTSSKDYKLTFNQDTNGNWYWVSTELVK